MNFAFFNPRPEPATRLLFFLIYLVVCLFLQFLSGVYESEMSHYPDEPAHIVTSLMIRDYVTDGLFSNPLTFAEAYYVHYPKVAIGWWPPMYYAITGVWLLAAGVSPFSFLFWSAIQTAFLSLIAYWLAERFFSTRVAFLLGLLFTVSPLVISSTSLVMVDVMVSNFSLIAGYFVWRYFEFEQRRDIVIFAVFTVVAMLTKANANAVVLTPVFLLAFTRKFYLLRRRDVYLSALIVVFFGLPWQIVSFSMMRGAVPVAEFSLGRVWRTAELYASDLVLDLGWPILMLSLIAVAIEFRKVVFTEAQRSRDAVLRATMLAFVLAIFIFHCVVPTQPENRYLLTMVPIQLIFAAIGLQTLIRCPLDSLRGLIAGVAIMVTFFSSTFLLPSRQRLGFSTIARSVPPSKPVVLICSDSNGEGSFISSIALREQRLGHIVLRGSKILSENTWIPTHYKPVFASTSALQAYLFENVDSVVVDLSQTLWEKDRDLLLQCLRENPHTWHLAAKVREARDIELYDRIGPPLPPNRKIRVPMTKTLNRDLEYGTDLPVRK